MTDNNWSAPLLKIRRLIEQCSEHAMSGDFEHAESALGVARVYMADVVIGLRAEAKRRDNLERSNASKKG